MTPAELRERRKALNLSQAALAAAIGVPLRSLQNWEIGHRGIPRFTAEHLDRELSNLERQPTAPRP